MIFPLKLQLVRGYLSQRIWVKNIGLSRRWLVIGPVISMLMPWKMIKLENLEHILTINCILRYDFQICSTSSMCYDSLPTSPLFNLLRHGSLWLGHGVRCSPLPSEQRVQTEGREWIWRVWPGIVSAQLSSLQSPCWFMMVYDYPTQYIGDYNNPIGGSLLTNQYIQYNGITGGFWTLLNWRRPGHLVNSRLNQGWY